MMDAGVPFGASRPYQPLALYPVEDYYQGLCFQYFGTRVASILVEVRPHREEVTVVATAMLLLHWN